jgi:serine O-acetyltransferase
MRKVYRWYAVANWLYLHKVPLLPRAITLLVRLVFGGYIPHQAKIGSGTDFGYGGIGVVVHDDCVIGRACTISQGVTLGGGGRDPGVPVVEDGVIVGAGAMILGPIRLGENCVVGANAVVTKDVPANAVVAGIPARVLREGRVSDEAGEQAGSGR